MVLLPEGMETSRAKIIRWPFTGACIQWRAKVIKTGWQVFVKVQHQHQALLDEVVTAMRQFQPPPR